MGLYKHVYYLKLGLCGAFTSRNFPKMTKIYPKIAFWNPAKPSHCKSSFHETVATEILFWNKALHKIFLYKHEIYWYQQGHNQRSKKFSKINFKKSSGSSIYKTSSPAEIENEREFFWHQNESIYRSQILPKLLNSKQLYCATKLPHVT